MADPTRQRTYTWDDMTPALEAARRLSGLEYLHAMVRGELPPPPIGRTLGMEPGRLEDFTEGRAVFRLKPQEFHHNPIGSVHGGVFATLLDSALACAIHTTLPAGVGYTTLELKFNCIRPLLAGGPEVQAIGQVVAATRQTAIAEGRIVDDSGKLYAHATTTCLLLR
ncbi:PaaI family thioesterase [Deinococcus sedimenti]|nr:PaaI family thioesterase [Deinococcus sedimenti]